MSPSHSLSITLLYTTSATTMIYTLSLHDALPIYLSEGRRRSPCHTDRHKPNRVHQWHSGSESSRPGTALERDRKSTRLNSSHVAISYAVFCLKKKKLKKH